MVYTHRSLTRLAALGVAAVLGGCALLAPFRPPTPAPQPQQQPQPPPASSQAPQPPTPNQPPPHSPPTHTSVLSPAMRSLVTQARAQATRGDLPAASSTIDRALRIEPDNPLLWVERGRLRLTENDSHQAEGCARKALSLANGDARAQAQAGRLLSDALRAQQRNQESRTVESQYFKQGSTQ